MKRGKFIVVEGGEGAGKTTLLEYAKTVMPNAVFTREPGGTPVAEKIRTLILSSDLKGASGETQFGLFWAARADHMKNLIVPSLEAGKHVIVDRFDSSSYAYQIHGQEARHLKDLFMKVRETYLKEAVPDLYVFLKVDPDVGLSRVASREASRKGEKNHFDERAKDFHARLTKGYEEFISAFPHVVIDANQPVERVREAFLAAVSKLVD